MTLGASPKSPGDSRHRHSTLRNSNNLAYRVLHYGGVGWAGSRENFDEGGIVGGWVFNGLIWVRSVLGIWRCTMLMKHLYIVFLTVHMELVVIANPRCLLYSLTFQK
jgi:hypothetical protein